MEPGSGRHEAADDVEVFAYCFMSSSPQERMRAGDVTVTRVRSIKLSVGSPVLKSTAIYIGTFTDLMYASTLVHRFIHITVYEMFGALLHT